MKDAPEQPASGPSPGPSRNRACTDERGRGPSQLPRFGRGSPAPVPRRHPRVGLLCRFVNAVVREPSGGLAGGHFVGPPALPVVQMLKPGDWRCPGPLPVGAGAESSRISIVNSGPSAVNLLLVVSRTGLPKRGSRPAPRSPGRGSRSTGTHRRSCRLTTGQPGFAAVSVETDAGGIGVGESVAGSSGAVPVLLSSPCSLVAGAQGYVPTGSTYGGSDVRAFSLRPRRHARRW